jgi:NAD(P)-dependent dehydrogenase (short-subunit alcohol dehydrogenase family)
MAMMKAVYDFSGKRFLVTGPSPQSSIGQAIAQRLAASGASVILVARGEDGLKKTLATLAHPKRHVVAPFDLNDLDGIPPWMKKIAEEYGPLDGLVHSASAQGFHPVRAITAEDYEDVFRINVGASLMLARGLRQKTVANRPASLVYIGSSAGLRGVKGRALYAGSKATQIAMTKTLGIELAAEKIRVNCVAPGVVNGYLAECMFERMSAENKAALLAAHPLGYGEGTDVAAATAFLLSDEARMVTGATLPVDGGYSAL